MGSREKQLYIPDAFEWQKEVDLQPEPPDEDEAFIDSLKVENEKLRKALSEVESVIENSIDFITDYGGVYSNFKYALETAKGALDG